MASTYLTRTQTAGNRRTWTWSGWIKRADIGSRQTILSAGIDGSNESFLRFDASDYISIKESISNSPEFAFDTTPVFRDPSAWYHIVFAVDTTQSTASDRVKLYVNGSQITSFSSASYPSQNYETRWGNNSQATYIGQNVPAYQDIFDGYMAHVHFTDGYAYAASTFGSTATNGQWVPNLNPSVTYGTNGYFLKFTNASDLGEDSSGNNNDFTKSGSGDKVSDNPENVFATLSTINPSASNFTISEGNLKVSKTGTGTVGLYSQTLMPTSGKWYFEVKIVTRGSSDRTRVGIANYESVTGTSTIQDSYSGVEISTASDDKIFIVVNGSTTENTTFYTALSDNDIVRFAVDMDNGRLYIGVNGNWWNYSSSQTGGDPTSGSGYVTNNTTIFNGSPMTAYTGHSAGSSTSNVQQFNFGNPPFSITSGNSDDNGYGNFEYAPPSGYLALCTQNLATELSLPIGKGGSYFNSLLWTGDNTTRNITGVGFAPNWTWIKCRSDGAGHVAFDTVRGASVRNVPNATAGDTTTNEYGFVTAFGSDGFTLTPGDQGTYASGDTNMSGRTYVGWNWRASGSTASNTDGSITSTVSANTTAGFSILTFTGTGSNVSVGHGLNQAPEILIVKSRASSANWNIYTSAIDGSLDYLFLNNTDAAGNASNSLPTSSVIYQNQTDSSVAYCFHSVEGYSKIGKYTGNGSTDGTFIYTGFRPAFILMKSSTSAENWLIYDSKRDPYNVTDEALLPNSSSASGGSANAMDLLSNGFKFRSSAGSLNGSGQTYIYMAFAENPFVDSSGIPVTAR